MVVMDSKSCLLIPVELERNEKKALLSFADWKDIITNISLQAKLVDNGVEIPDFESKKQKRV